PSIARAGAAEAGPGVGFRARAGRVLGWEFGAPGECTARHAGRHPGGVHRGVDSITRRWDRRPLTRKPDQMSRAELVAQLRRRDDEGCRRLARDLRVHHEALEAQQVQLVAAQQALEHARDLSADLFEFAPRGYVLLASTGAIQQIHGPALTLLGITDRGRVA